MLGENAALWPVVMTPSPKLQRQPSYLTHATPSTVDASPQQDPGPLAAFCSTEATGQRQDPARTRSTIACDKCRKSKTKCQNDGINTTCKACFNSKRECVYGSSASTGSSGEPRPPSVVADGDVSQITSRTWHSRSRNISCHVALANISKPL